MNGLTNTLALHMDKVCACTEIDYDKLPQLIQDKTHLLNIYGKNMVKRLRIFVISGIL